VASPDGKKGKVIETDNGTLSGVTVCGTPITALSLKGNLKQLGWGGGED